MHAHNTEYMYCDSWSKEHQAYIKIPREQLVAVYKVFKRELRN